MALTSQTLQRLKAMIGGGNDLGLPPGSRTPDIPGLSQILSQVGRTFTAPPRGQPAPPIAAPAPVRTPVVDPRAPVAAAAPNPAMAAPAAAPVAAAPAQAPIGAPPPVTNNGFPGVQPFPVAPFTGQHNVPLPGDDDPYSRLQIPTVTGGVYHDDGPVETRQVSGPGQPNLNYAPRQVADEMQARFGGQVRESAPGMGPSTPFTMPSYSLDTPDEGLGYETDVPVQQIAFWLERGDTEQQIRERLGLSPQTIGRF